MSKGLKGLIVFTDVAFLGYWSLSLLHLVGLLSLPPALMYAGFEQARVFAWNWSFLPVDVLFSITGLLAVRLARVGDPRWRPLSIISLCLTFVAGFMAVAYWTILGEFDPGWYLPNLALVVWPLLFIPGLVEATTHPA